MFGSVLNNFLCSLHFQACQKALIAHYGEEFNSFHLAMNDKDEFTVETDVDLGLIASEQRIVELDKVRLFRGLGSSNLLSIQLWL